MKKYSLGWSECQERADHDLELEAIIRQRNKEDLEMDQYLEDNR